MKQKQYIVDAFTDKIFEGNSAAVCIMEKWMPDDVMLVFDNEEFVKIMIRTGQNYATWRR